MKQQTSISQTIQNTIPNNWNSPPTPNTQQPQQQRLQTANLNAGPIANILNLTNVSRDIEAIITQQNTLRDQIRQSEQNLTAQHGVLI